MCYVATCPAGMVWCFTFHISHGVWSLPALHKCRAGLDSPDRSIPQTHEPQPMWRPTCVTTSPNAVWKWWATSHIWDLNPLSSIDQGVSVKGESCHNLSGTQGRKALGRSHWDSRICWANLVTPKFLWKMIKTQRNPRKKKETDQQVLQSFSSKWVWVTIKNRPQTWSIFRMNPIIGGPQIPPMPKSFPAPLEWSTMQVFRSGASWKGIPSIYIYIYIYRYRYIYIYINGQFFWKMKITT